MGKAQKIVCLLASLFLVFMGLFHGSGFAYLTDLMQQSDAKDILKRTYPILFVHTSFHLFALGTLGFLATCMDTKSAKMTLWLVAVFVALDAGLALYLEEVVPSVVLSVVAICFLYCALVKKK